MPDTSQFFTYDKAAQGMRFTGNHLTLWINQRWEPYGGLTISGNRVMAIACGDFLVDESIWGGLMLAGITEFFPREFSFERTDKGEFLKLEFAKNDLVLNTNIVQTTKLAYAVFYEYLYIGAIPRFLNYDNIFELFDKVSEATGSVFPVDHVIWELFYAQIFRQRDNISLPARLATAKQTIVQIPLRDVVHLASSTSAKLVGSYFSDAVDAALVHPADEPTLLETILSQ